MAVAAQNATYLTQGPAATGQIIANNEKSSTELALVGTATFTLDGATTSATLNFIDGTQTLPFTPSAVLATVVGGNQGATAVVTVTTDTITNTGCTVRFSAAGTAAKTLQIAFIVLK